MEIAVRNHWNYTLMTTFMNIFLKVSIKSNTFVASNKNYNPKTQ